MVREIEASKLGIGLIAALRANGIDRFIFSDEAIYGGARAIIKKLEKNGIKIDDRFEFRNGFTGIGFRYGILDYGVSGTYYIELSKKGAEDYFRHCVKGEDLDFFKSLAKRFWGRALRRERCERIKYKRNFDVYFELKEKRRKAYFKRL